MNLESPTLIDSYKEKPFDETERERAHKMLDLTLDQAYKGPGGSIAILSIGCCFLYENEDLPGAFLNTVSSKLTSTQIASFASGMVVSLADDWNHSQTLNQHGKP